MIQPLIFSCELAARSASVVLSHSSATAKRLVGDSLRLSLSSWHYAWVDTSSKLAFGVGAFEAPY
ncbi:hypothetical protein ACXZ1M_10090 [Duganella sp. PWIR1]